MTERPKGEKRSRAGCEESTARSAVERGTSPGGMISARRTSYRLLHVPLNSGLLSPRPSRLLLFPNRTSPQSHSSSALVCPAVRSVARTIRRCCVNVHYGMQRGAHGRCSRARSSHDITEERERQSSIWVPFVAIHCAPINPKYRTSPPAFRPCDLEPPHPLFRYLPSSTAYPLACCPNLVLARHDPRLSRAVWANVTSALRALPGRRPFGRSVPCQDGMHGPLAFPVSPSRRALAI